LHSQISFPNVEFITATPVNVFIFLNLVLPLIQCNYILSIYLLYSLCLLELINVFIVIVITASLTITLTQTLKSITLHHSNARIHRGKWHGFSAFYFQGIKSNKAQFSYCYKMYSHSALIRQCKNSLIVRGPHIQGSGGALLIVSHLHGNSRTAADYEKTILKIKFKAIVCINYNHL